MPPQPAVGPVRRPRQLPGWIALFSLTLGAGLGRLLWLEWQPLWWDEGYTVYFATEPVARMAWLTAHDIHPPLYFALLHLWTTALDSYGPVSFRIFSVLGALPAIPLSALLMHKLLSPVIGKSWRVPLLTAALMAINPMHLYYSQEVRMYGLALSFSLLATLAIVDYAQKSRTGRPAHRVALVYIFWASLALYTLYYTAWLLLAHLVWLVYSNRQAPPLRTSSRWTGRWSSLWPSLWPYVAIFAAYTPWLFYAGPKLLAYVQSKVAADEDSPLSVVHYIWQHALAFSSGHLQPEILWLQIIRYVGIAGVLILLVYAGYRGLRGRPNPSTAPTIPRAAMVALGFFLVVPLALGFLVNLVYPFFPIGGERLLFYALPYAVGLLAISITKTQRVVTVVALGTWIAASVIGVFTFYSVPRYTTEDYRPVVRAVLEHGRPQDQVLAIFPWQIGYWRAYTPRADHGGHTTWLGPQAAPLDQDFLEWNDAQQARIDAALDAGTVWFPAPLGFGSTLPHEIEAYLRTVSANAYNTWYSPTTRLSAWTPAHGATSPPAGPANLSAGDLRAVHIAETTVAADNSPLVLRIYWQNGPVSEIDTEQRVELALTNVTDGRTWAARSYQPRGHYSAEAFPSPTADTFAEDNVALIVPPGIPPGEYRLRLGVAPVGMSGLSRGNMSGVTSGDAPGESTSIEAGVDSFSPAETKELASVAPMQDIATIQITMPDQPVSPWRLPAEGHYDNLIPTFRSAPLAAAGLQLWSVTGLPRPTSPQLAGTNLSAMFHLAIMDPPPDDAQLMAEVRSPDGTAVAHTSVALRTGDSRTAWQRGTLISQPVDLFLPGYLQADSQYTLWGGIAANTETHFRAWGTVPLVQRAPNLERPIIATELDTPVQFGTHVMLLGYTLTESNRDSATSPTTGPGALTLHWQVLQPLVPPHHMFAHFVDASNIRIAQQDGEPITADGPAPTGTWHPGEYLTTSITLSALELEQAQSAQVGIYHPATEIRLPAAQNGNVIGDYLAIPLNSIHP